MQNLNININNNIQDNLNNPYQDEMIENGYQDYIQDDDNNPYQDDMQDNENYQDYIQDDENPYQDDIQDNQNNPEILQDDIQDNNNNPENFQNMQNNGINLDNQNNQNNLQIPQDKIQHNGDKEENGQDEIQDNVEKMESVNAQIPQNIKKDENIQDISNPVNIQVQGEIQDNINNNENVQNKEQFNENNPENLQNEKISNEMDYFQDENQLNENNEENFQNEKQPNENNVEQYQDENQLNENNVEQYQDENQFNENENFQDGNQLNGNNGEIVHEDSQFNENNPENFQDENENQFNDNPYQDDIQDNENGPENFQNDMQDNNNINPENIQKDQQILQNNIINPDNQILNSKDNNINVVNDAPNLNNNIDNNNPPMTQEQFNDDEEYYGDNENEINKQSIPNVNNNDNLNEEEEVYEDAKNDNEDNIDNQNVKEESPIKQTPKKLPIDNIKSPKENEIVIANNNNLLDNQLQNNNILNNFNFSNQKHSEASLSYEPSSKNNNIPNVFPDSNNLKQNLITNINSSPVQKNSNNNMEQNSELGEIDLKNLNPEEYFDMNENNENNINLDIQKENERDKEIEEILEDLYIEEYNPSLGLVKIDNPKYMNAVIQCLAHIPELTDKIINLHSDEKIKKELPNLRLTKRYRNLLINIFLPEKVYNMNRKPYNPNIFMNTLCEINPLYLNNENIELNDFIDCLIVNLHNELNTKKNDINNDVTSENINKDIQMKNENEVLTEFLQQFTNNNNSLISNNVYGISKYTFYCHQCQNPFYNYKPFYSLYFNLDNVRAYKQSRCHKDINNININDCLDFYQKSETLIGEKGLYCPSCKQQTESTSIKNIYSLTNVLIFILDRNIGNNFNQCNVEFKESISLADYVQFKKDGEKNNEKFYLCGVINCSLDIDENDSYNAFIKVGKNNEWHCYEDEKIYPVSFQDIKNIGYPIALFYHKLPDK